MSQWTNQTLETEAVRPHLVVDLIEGWLPLIKISEVAFEHHPLTLRKGLTAATQDRHLVPLNVKLQKDRSIRNAFPKELVERRLLDLDSFFVGGMRPGVEVLGPHRLKGARVIKAGDIETLNSALITQCKLKDSELWVIAGQLLQFVKTFRDRLKRIDFSGWKVGQNLACELPVTAPDIDHCPWRRETVCRTAVGIDGR